MPTFHQLIIRVINHSTFGRKDEQIPAAKKLARIEAADQRNNRAKILFQNQKILSGQGVNKTYHGLLAKKRLMDLRYRQLF